ncbi:hypothetical protein A7X93_13630 [Stenotrophomonas maltophilia]|nr:hypothetical protein A7X93_13630 [Stenotrophomonas maltophilia]
MLRCVCAVEDITETPSERNRECVGQGVANTVTGFLGGMAGCAMIGQSIINVSSGGRGRLSCLVAGVVLLAMVVYGSELGAAFDYQHVAPKVQIDLRDAHLWDLTAVAALERAQEKLAAHGADVTVVGLNAASRTLIEQVGGRGGGH